MKLRSQPPAGVVASLEQSGGQPGELVLSVASDLNHQGAYAPQWLLVSGQRVWVIDQSQPHPPMHMLELSAISEFRVQPVVGSGLLQARTDGLWVDLVRFSNRLKYPFCQVAQRLEQLRQGQSMATSDLEDQEPHVAAELALIRVSKGAAIWRVMSLMRPYWRMAGAMMGLLVLGIVLDMVWPLLTRFMVDWVLSDPPPAGPHPVPALQSMEPMSLLLLIVGCLAGVQVLRMVVQVVNGWLSSRVGSSITFDIRARLVEHLTRLGLSYYDRQQTGSLVGRVAYDTEAVHSFMNQLTSGFLMQLLLVVLSMGMMLTLEPTLAFWALVPAPLVLASTVVFYRYVYPHYQRLWDRSSKQAGMLSGLLSGVRVVKAFAQEQHELGRFARSSADLRDTRRRLDMNAAMFYPTMGLVFQMGGWIVWYVGGRNVLEHDLTLGTLMAFFGYMGMFYGPLSSLTNLTSWLTQFATQTHRIFEVLDARVDVPEPVDPAPMPRVRGDIEFRNVSFGYRRDNPVLRSVSLTIRAGEAIGIVGRSGSGKTTLVNLISRFYDPDEGQVLIDGVDLKRIARQDLRAAVSVVLQEPFLFRGTIWENLLYGRRDATEEEVITASRAANAHDFILRQPQGYDTWVGERGAGLSGGERQRLSLARALLCDPRILILDEATSSIDSESELAIQKALVDLVRGRTSIIIAHRLSTLRHCDRILVVDEGRIVESGTHEQLMRLNGRYARMVNIQQGTGRDDVDADLLVAPASQPAAGAAQALAEGSSSAAEEGGSSDTRVATLAPPAADAEPSAAEQAREQAASLQVDPDTGLGPVDGYQPRWLTPQIASIHLGNLGALHVTILNEGIYHGIQAARCLPVQQPNRLISLRYLNSEDREQEIGLIRDLADWPPQQQRLIQEALLKRYFVHTVRRVLTIRRLQQYLEVDLDTDLGPRQFIMRYSSEAAQDYGRGGKILLDVEGNLYLVPQVAELPPSDRRLFERYIYW